MATITPTFVLSLKGDTKVKTLEKTVTWNACEQNENIIKINAVDGEQTIDLASIDESLKLIIISCSSAFIVKLTSAGNTIEQETKLYVLEPGTNYLTGIDSFVIYTNSTDKINIDLRIYGEATA